MENFYCNQFIYGKTDRGQYGYEITGYQDEHNSLDELEAILKEYKFWGIYSQKGKHRAVGIAPHPNRKDQVVLFHVAPAKGFLIREFDQYRYIFVPLQFLSRIKFCTFKLLPSLYEENIPILPEVKPNLEKFDIFSLQKDDERKKTTPESEIVETCLSNEKIASKKLPNYPFLLFALLVLSAGKRLLLTSFKGYLNPERFYLPSILLLLPAPCRAKLSIAAGDVHEHQFSWAQLVIINAKSEEVKRSIPNDCIWLDRQQNNVRDSDSDNLDDLLNNNKYDDLLNNKYVEKIYNFIQEQPERLSALIRELNEVSEPLSLSLDDLKKNPYLIFEQIPSFNDLAIQNLNLFKQNRGFSDLANLVEKFCYLQDNTPEEIKPKIESIQSDSGKLDLMLVLLEQNKLSEACLPRFADLPRKQAKLILGNFLDYINNCLDTFSDLKRFSACLYSNKNKQVDFIDSLLGNQEKFVVDVLNFWFSTASDVGDSTVGNRSSLQLLELQAWKKFKVSPESWVNDLFSEKRNLELELTQIAIENLLELSANQINLIKSPVLQYIDRCYPKQRQESLQRSTLGDRLLINVACAGNILPENDENWEIIVKRSLSSGFSADLALLIRKLRESSQDTSSLRCRLLEHAQEIAKGLKQKEELESLLEKCQAWKFNQSEIVHVFNSAIKQHYIPKIDVELILTYLNRHQLKKQILDCQDLSKFHLQLKLLFDSRESSKLRQSDYGFFVEVLEDLLDCHCYPQLRQWKHFYYDDLNYKHFYKKDFIKASADLFSSKLPDEIIQDLKDNEFQEEAAWLEEEIKIESKSVDDYSENKMKDMKEDIKDMKEDIKDMKEDIKDMKEDIKDIFHIFNISFTTNKVSEGSRQNNVDQSPMHDSKLEETQQKFQSSEDGEYLTAAASINEPIAGSEAGEYTTQANDFKKKEQADPKED